MDILIKNMEMPDGEDIVLLVRPNGDVRKITRFKLLEFEGSAKAVALPEHGRLGDLDKIANRFHGFYEKHLENGSYETAEIWKYAEQEVRLQGTVVEGNNGTDN